MTIAGDKTNSDFLSASDEAGNVVVWSVEEELDRDGTNPDDYRCEEIYRYTLDEDLCCALAVKGSIVIAGHVSGYLTFHDVDHRMMLCSLISNTRGITCIDTSSQRDLVLVCGEDCRVTVLGFSESRGHKPVVHFSVALDTMITGCAVQSSPRGCPRLAMLTWPQSQILQYEYEKSGHRGKKRAEQSDASPSPRNARHGPSGPSSRHVGALRLEPALGPSDFAATAPRACLKPFFRPNCSARESDGTGSYYRDDFSVRSQSP